VTTTVPQIYFLSISMIFYNNPIPASSILTRSVLYSQQACSYVPVMLE